MVHLSAVYRRVAAVVSSGWLHSALSKNTPSVRVLEASWTNTNQHFERWRSERMFVQMLVSKKEEAARSREQEMHVVQWSE